VKKILELASKLETFQNRIPELINEIVRDNEEIVLDMNTEEQLFEKGIDRNNEQLSAREPYTPFTLSIKQQKGQPTSRVTLRDSGDFQRSFFISYRSDGFEIRASDWKFGDLVDRFGPIMGLTDENLQDLLRNYILPDLLKELKS
jgi:hypothetical protein